MDADSNDFARRRRRGGDRPPRAGRCRRALHRPHPHAVDRSAGSARRTGCRPTRSAPSRSIRLYAAGPAERRGREPPDPALLDGPGRARPPRPAPAPRGRAAAARSRCARRHVRTRSRSRWWSCWRAMATTLTVRGLDCLDGTPLLDIKPYYATDRFPARGHGRPSRDRPRMRRRVALAAAAVLLVGAGILVGRMLATAPVNVRAYAWDGSTRCRRISTRRRRPTCSWPAIPTRSCRPRQPAALRPGTRQRRRQRRHRAGLRRPRRDPAASRSVRGSPC